VNGAAIDNAGMRNATLRSDAEPSRATLRALELLTLSPSYRKQFNNAVFIAASDDLAVRLDELLRLEWQRQMDDIAISSQLDMADIDWTRLAKLHRERLLTGV
jgi:hypothetical protein